MNYNEAVDILELPENYNESDINRSFRKLASKYHPDKGGDSEYMKKIIEAKQVLDQENLKNTGLTVKQLEIALQTIETKKTELEKYERVVRKLESVATTRVVGSLKSKKSMAYIASASFLGATFLSKEVPKEIFSLFTPYVIEKPTPVQEPVLPLKIKSELNKEKWDFGGEVQSEEKNSVSSDIETQELVNKYEHELKQYNQYVTTFAMYQEQQSQISRFKVIWYSFMFAIAGYSGLFGWRCQHWVRRVEEDLEEVMSNLRIKSRYVLTLKEIFDGTLPNQWTLEELEVALLENKFKNNMLNKLHMSLGTSKLSQLLIAKGQENGFVSMLQGNEENDFQEIYSLVAKKI